MNDRRLLTGFTCTWCHTRRAMNIYGPAEWIECWNCGTRQRHAELLKQLETALRVMELVTAA